MAIDHSANFNDSASSVVAPYDSSSTGSILYESIMPDMQNFSRLPERSIQTAGILDDAKNYLYNLIFGPSTQDGAIRGQRGDSTIRPENGTGAAVPPEQPFESFRQDKRPRLASELPQGGQHLENKYKNVVSSFYEDPQKTSTGGDFDPEGLTAAHRTLPIGTVVTLTFKHPVTGEVKVVSGVTITDDGPRHFGNEKARNVSSKPRELDVSRRVATELGLRSDNPEHDVGVGEVKMTITRWPPGAVFRNQQRELDRYWGRSNFSIYQ